MSFSDGDILNRKGVMAKSSSKQTLGYGSHWVTYQFKGVGQTQWMVDFQGNSSHCGVNKGTSCGLGFYYTKQSLIHLCHTSEAVSFLFLSLLQGNGNRGTVSTVQPLWSTPVVHKMTDGDAFSVLVLIHSPPSPACPIAVSRKFSKIT